MYFQSFVAAATLAAVVSAKTCMNMTVPVTISARNGVFGNFPTPQTNLDAAGFAVSGTMQGFNGTAAALTGYKTVSGTYNISVQYCVPPKSKQSSKPKLQILTHGVAFDKTYWDLAYNNFNYSYVDVALAKGYHVFNYDRLGIGKSSHGDPKDEIQIFLEVAALAKLTDALRNGHFPGINTKFDKIIHVGHSYGSIETYFLTALHPSISDGIVLTGFSFNTSFLGLFLAGNDFVQARLNQPKRLGHYAPGYLTNSNAASNLYAFLLPRFFDTGILFFSEKTKQPVTVGELLTQNSFPKTSKFKGPVLVFTGSNDVPFCGGACTTTGDPKVPSLPAAAEAAFLDAKKFSAYIQPNTGHGINLHYNATSGYRYIQSWLRNSGL